ncbi:cell division protein FtsQ/DivIB [Acetobacter estunensis]|uniref:cell division protein FtsQ/DivIB n=1 Tax=Acetobacter estunensis TaxID=104097 RepID=UPI001C2D7ED3|nr:cell division protein FtsQ/DivIB [Acetobacter estunensis]MBV1836712.1 cell division protein FtsQ/DivIB [Acetobacter estunensis]
MSRRHHPHESRDTEGGNRFRHTSRADRPSRLGLFLRRHKHGVRMVVSCAVLAGVGWGFLSFHGTQRVLAPLTTRIVASLPLKVTDIRIEGQNLTNPVTIHEALGIAVGDPMLGFDVKAARARLDALPFVEHASVERHLSGLIVVRLEERPPFAVWQRKGQFILIDRDGNPVPDKGMTGKDALAFMKLPLVVGDGADRAAAEFLDALAKAPDVKERMTAATLVGERRWSLMLRDGTTVYLPEAAEVQAFDRLETLQKRFALLDRPVEIIDLRLPDRLTIRERPTPASDLPSTDGQAGAGSSATPDEALRSGQAGNKGNAAAPRPKSSDPARKKDDHVERMDEELPA